MKRAFAYLGIAVLAFAIAWPAWTHLGACAQVPVSVVRRGTVLATVFATGHVEARERRVLRPHRAGIIGEVYAKEGSEVRVGDKLLVLRDTARSARRARVEADLQFVEQEAARHRTLYEKGHVSKQVLDELESRRRKLQAELDLASAGEADDLLVSPLDGIVLFLDVKAGEPCRPELDLAKVGDVRDLVVEGEVDEEEIGRVREGQEVLIRLAGDSGALVSGEVYEILPDADRMTKSYRVRARFREARFEPAGPLRLGGRLLLPGGIEARSGMSAELGIVVDRKERVLTIPRSALTSRGTVFVVQGGRAAERPVRIGIQNFESSELLEGLREGEVVAAGGLDGLRSGRRIRPARGGLPGDPP